MAKYLTPVVTPMRDGCIDYQSAAQLYERLIDGGVDGILVLGSIGEFFAFDMEQKKQLIRFAVQTIRQQVQLIVGTTAMVFREITELSNFALDAGAQSVMVIPPYYFPTAPAEIAAYYRRLATEIHGGLYIYNFPDRTGYSIPVETVRQLAQSCPNIIGVKDTIGGMDHTRELIRAVKPLRPAFEVYSGFDDNFLHNVLCGGDGCIAGLSNLFPELTSAWAKAARLGDMAAAAEIQQRIDSLMAIYQVGTPFVPYIKEALRQQGILRSAEASFPMPAVDEAASARIAEILKNA